MTFGLDPYKVLGVAPGATKAEIRHAYRCMAKRYHPDVNNGDAEMVERFKEIQWAYEVLTRDRLEFGMRSPTGSRFVVDEDPFLILWTRYITWREGKQSKPWDADYKEG